MCIEEIFGESVSVLTSDLHNIMSDVHTILLWMINQTNKIKAKETIKESKPEDDTNKKIAA